MIRNTGGSIYLGAYNSIMLTDVNFTKSIASRDGGAIYADAGNDIVITTSTFQGMLYIIIKLFDSHMSKLIM